MKILYIKTKEDDRYRSELERAGFFVTVSEEDRPDADFIICGTEVFTADADTSPIHNPEKMIILSGETDHRQKDILLAHGISHVLASEEPARLIEYLNMLISMEETKSPWHILIGEENPSIKATLKGLLGRFGCIPIFVESNDEFFSNITTPDIQFLLLNLGLKNFDINEFIRRASGSMEVKRIPFIAYRDLNDGIFINEVIGGLNRLTRFILSPRELYSLLAGMLYRTEIIPSIHNLSLFSCMEEHADFRENSIVRVYHQQRENLFSLPDISSPECLEKFSQYTRELHNSVLKIEGLQWLIETNTGETINTCGEGG